tara:strand:- start:161 stop:847 length:687 start_codon:yes stop_codon:yes gene_type:complete
MKKLIIIFILILATIIFFNKKLIEIYFSYKLSNWVEKRIIFDDFNIKYPNLISINQLKIVNLDSFYYENVFEAEKVAIKFDLRSLLFNELIIITHLRIEKPKFFLELIEKKFSSEELTKEKKIIYEDNIGLAKKINENLPDKIWPIKKKDINFLILRSYISDGKTYIKVSSIIEPFENLLSDFRFTNVGNHKEHQHYKEVLKLMFFDMYASVKDYDLKKLLKKVYNFK